MDTQTSAQICKSWANCLCTFIHSFRTSTNSLPFLLLNSMVYIYYIYTTVYTCFKNSTYTNTYHIAVFCHAHLHLANGHCCSKGVAAQKAAVPWQHHGFVWKSARGEMRKNNGTTGWNGLNGTSYFYLADLGNFIPHSFCFELWELTSDRSSPNVYNIQIYIDFHIILIPYLPNDLKPVVLPGTPHGSTLAPGPIARFDQGSYSSSSSEKKKYLGETRRESVENLFWIRGWGWVESGGITMWQPLHYIILYTYLGTVESLSPCVFPTFVSISSRNSVIIQWTPVSFSWQHRHVWPPEEEKEEQEEAGTGRWR